MIRLRERLTFALTKALKHLATQHYGKTMDVWVVPAGQVKLFTIGPDSEPQKVPTRVRRLN